AEEQRKGKGRLGRSWISPPKGGIYFSCVLRPEMSPDRVSQITLAASVSVAKAVRELTGLQAMIRWPNDILVNDRKICGILTEMKAEQDTVRFLIVGIGINANTSKEGLPDAASSLEAESGIPVSRIRLAQMIIRELERSYVTLINESFLPIRDEWKQLTHMLGSRVTITILKRTIEGQAIDIDNDGALLVRLDNGFIERISSGDVTIAR
ncbi:MAG: biotin--[acetyl-CoA-carboxylase] ligase, partial [Candidatus Omnitrophota bacterium]